MIVYYHNTRIPKAPVQAPSLSFSFSRLGLFVLFLQQQGIATFANNNHAALTDDTIRDAVSLYLSEDPSDIGTLFSQYGEISDWDTSQVTDFSYLFLGATKNLANLDLSSWNISSATTLRGMFQDASNLNGNTFCFNTWNNNNIHNNVNVQDMFCGTDGASLDPCCTPDTILEQSCCQTEMASCNSICLGTNLQFPPTSSSPTTTATATATTSSSSSSNAPAFTTATTTTTTTINNTTVSGEGSYVFQPNAPDDDLYNTDTTTSGTNTTTENNTPTVVQVATDNTNVNNNNNNNNNNANSNQNGGIPWYQSELFLGFLGFFVGSLLLLALTAFVYKKRNDRATQKKATELHSNELMLTENDNNNNNNNGKPPLERMIDIEIQPTEDSCGSDDDNNNNNHNDNDNHNNMMEHTGIECNLSMDDTYLMTEAVEEEGNATTTENDTTTANDKSLYSL